MSAIDTVIARLEGNKLKRAGAGWVACCPAHPDKNPSLSVRESDSGSVLIHCHGGCAVENVVAAMGLVMQDLFPPEPGATHHHKPRGNRLSAGQALQIIKQDALFVYLCSKEMAAGRTLTPADTTRLSTAAMRIQAAAEEAGL